MRIVFKPVVTSSDEIRRLPSPGTSTRSGSAARPTRSGSSSTPTSGRRVVACITDTGQHFRMVASVVDMVPPDEDLPKLAVARAL